MLPAEVCKNDAAGAESVATGVRLITVDGGSRAACDDST